MLAFLTFFRIAVAEEVVVEEVAEVSGEVGKAEVADEEGITSDMQSEADGPEILLNVPMGFRVNRKWRG